MGRPGHALFARMQAISPACSTLYDTPPQIIRSCEPHASTDTFVSRDKQCPCTYSYWYIYQYVTNSAEPRAQAVSTAAAAAVQTSGTFGVLAVFEVLHSLPYTSRRVLVLQYWYSHTSECVAVKRCRYHAIRGSVVCTCRTPVDHTYIIYKSQCNVKYHTYDNYENVRRNK